MTLVGRQARRLPVRGWRGLYRHDGETHRFGDGPAAAPTIAELARR